MALPHHGTIPHIRNRLDVVRSTVGREGGQAVGLFSIEAQNASAPYEWTRDDAPTHLFGRTDRRDHGDPVLLRPAIVNSGRRAEP
jgi:hypothetical protein